MPRNGVALLSLLEVHRQSIIIDLLISSARSNGNPENATKFSCNHYNKRYLQNLQKRDKDVDAENKENPGGEGGGYGCIQTCNIWAVGIRILSL